MIFVDCALYIIPYPLGVGCSVWLLHAWVNVEMAMNKSWLVGRSFVTKLEVKGI